MDSQRLNDRQLCGLRLLRKVDIPPHLQIQPKLRRRAKVLRQPQCGARGDATLAVDEFIGALIRHVDGVGKLTLRQFHRDEEFFEQHFAGVGGGAVGWNTGHVNTSVRIYNSRVNDIPIIEEFYRRLVNAVFPEQRKEPDATFADGETGRHPQRHDLGDKSAFAVRHFDFGVRLGDFGFVGDFPAPGAALVGLGICMQAHGQGADFVQVGDEEGDIHGAGRAVIAVSIDGDEDWVHSLRRRALRQPLLQRLLAFV